MMWRLTVEKSAAFQNLERKIRKSEKVIIEAEQRFGIENIFVAWTGGKDSTALLNLIRTIHNGKVPLKVIHIDTAVKFKEIHIFRDRLAKEWELDLKIIKNDDADAIIKSSENPVQSGYRLKEKLLAEAIKSYNAESLMTAIRWDAKPINSEENYFSERDGHTRVNPILHFLERDIWDYIKSNNLPYCELYEQSDCNSSCGSWKQPSLSGDERDDKTKDKEIIMERLRSLGYF